MRPEKASLARARALGLPLEVVAVWVLFAVVVLEVLVTYSRLPVHELYHVSSSGLAGGLSRVLVFLNFPLALVAIPILAVLAERLPGRTAKVAAGVGIVLSAAVFWPGVVKQSDLDARPVNAIAALGILVALSLTVVAARKLGRPPRPVRQTGDWLRVIVASLYSYSASRGSAPTSAFRSTAFPCWERSTRPPNCARSRMCPAFIRPSTTAITTVWTVCFSS